MPARSHDEREYDSVSVEVTGRDHDELAERALRSACKYFGVKFDDATLDTRVFHGVPHMFAASGKVDRYKATIVVFHRPDSDTSDADSGDSDDSDGESVTSAEELESAAVPPRTSARAVGPLGEEQWSDDDEDEDAEGFE